MKLIYSGKTKEFTSELEEKVNGKLAKLGKLTEQRGEREVHMTHHMERHLHKIELTMNLYDHGLTVEGVDADLQTSICHAIDKLEKQIVKVRDRWRDTHRDPKAVRSTKESWTEAASAEVDVAASKSNGKGLTNGTGRKPQIFRVDYDEDRKPMTLEEAILEMKGDAETDYVVYRNSERNCLNVLVRRSDGNFDLIES